MSWTTLTQNDLLSALNATEAAAYNAVLTGDINPADEIILTAVQEARGHIADCPRNQLAAGDTVPDRIKHHIIAIIRFRILTRLDIAVSEDRRAEYKDARRFLERVSECKVSIERPEGAVETSSGDSEIEIVEQSEVTIDREGLNQL
jgi:phage gp36-like protein